MGTAAAGALAVPGVVVGAVSTSGQPAPSAIEYPAAAQEQADLFAQALGVAGLLRSADVAHVTVVLGPDGHELLLATLRQFAGLPAPPCG